MYYTGRFFFGTFPTVFLSGVFRPKIEELYVMRGKGRLTGMTDISADSSRGDSDPSTLVQADLYEQ